MGIHVITDTSSDLRLDYAKENRELLTVLGMPIEIDGEGYVDDLGESFSKDFFYEKLKKGAFPTTSQISPTLYAEAYEKAIKNGDQVIVIGLSSGLSSTIHGATLAMKTVNEKYGEKVRVIDTVAGSIGLGLLVTYAIDRVKAGITYEDLCVWIEENKLKVNHWFAIDDLIHLKKGGRIPPTMAYVGTMLKVKPILTVSHQGKLGAYTKVRGRGKSMQYLISKLDEHIGTNTKETLLLGHADAIEDALRLKEKISERYPELKIINNCLSQTIATHVGPGMLAISFIGEHIREDNVEK